MPAGDDSKTVAPDPPDWRNRFVRKLNEKIPGLTNNCPQCGVAATGVNDKVWSANEFRVGGGLMIGGPSFPHAYLVCGNCGYARQFNLIILGVINPDGTLRND